MSDFAACIQTAIDAGEVDRQRGGLAQEKWAEQVRRYIDQGMAPDQARITAADDMVDAIASNTQRQRHTALAQLRDLNRAAAQMDGMALRDPDGLLKIADSVELKQRSLEQSFMGQISDFLKQTRTRMTGGTRDRAMVKNVTRELHGQDSGDAVAREMAEGIRGVQERARALFNALGGDIGKLENRGLAHAHNAAKIRAAGFDTWFRELWDNRALDWSRIRNLDTGKPFAPAPGARPHEADARAFLQTVFDQISTDGWATRQPSLDTGGTALYRRRAEHRVLHFVDGDAWLRYNDQFGQSNPFDALVGELRGMARDIALMDTFGPNPRAGLEYRAQMLEQQAATAPANAPAQLRDLIDRKNKKARVVLRHLTGAANVPHDKFYASFLAGVRNLLTAAQLGSAPISQITDLGTTALAARSVGMNARSPFIQTLNNMLRRITPEEARAYGYIYDTWFNSASGQARYLGDIWSPEWTSRVTNFVLRANGLSFLTDMQRAGMRISFSHELGEQAGRSFADLPPELRRHMEAHGFSAADWDAVRAPGTVHTSATGGKVITPTWFAEHAALPRLQAEQIALRLGTVIEALTERAVPTANVRGRATLGGDAAPGTFLGEVGRSGLMYKSYSLSLFFGQQRHIWQQNDTALSRAGAVALLGATMIPLAAVSIQLRQIAQGRDPRPMDQPDFWMAAATQASGVGIFGDFFSAEASRTGGGIAEALSGPVTGVAGDLNRARANIQRRLGDGDPAGQVLGREAVNLTRRYNPMATYWPTRTAVDRILWDNLQEILDPDARDQWRRQSQRLSNNFGTQLFWERGEGMPRRAPDLGNVMGAQR
jgi:hypothetical protein